MTTPLEKELKLEVEVQGQLFTHSVFAGRPQARAEGQAQWRGASLDRVARLDPMAGA
jgi:hypothetical protein